MLYIIANMNTMVTLISGTRSVLYDLSQSYFKFECVVMRADNTKATDVDLSAPINFPGI